MKWLGIISSVLLIFLVALVACIVGDRWGLGRDGRLAVAPPSDVHQVVVMPATQPSERIIERIIEVPVREVLVVVSPTTQPTITVVSEQSSVYVDSSGRHHDSVPPAYPQTGEWSPVVVHATHATVNVGAMRNDLAASRAQDRNATDTSARFPTTLPVEPKLPVYTMIAFFGETGVPIGPPRRVVVESLRIRDGVTHFQGGFTELTVRESLAERFLETDAEKKLAVMGVVRCDPVLHGEQVVLFASKRALWKSPQSDGIDHWNGKEWLRLEQVTALDPDAHPFLLDRSSFR
jgi:hypothetical protein